MTSAEARRAHRDAMVRGEDGAREEAVAYLMALSSDVTGGSNELDEERLREVADNSVRFGAIKAAARETSLERIAKCGGDLETWAWGWLLWAAETSFPSLFDKTLLTWLIHLVNPLDDVVDSVSPAFASAWSWMKHRREEPSQTVRAVARESRKAMGRFWFLSTEHLPWPIDVRGEVESNSIQGSVASRLEGAGVRAGDHIIIIVGKWGELHSRVEVTDVAPLRGQVFEINTDGNLRPDSTIQDVWLAAPNDQKKLSELGVFPETSDHTCELQYSKHDEAQNIILYGPPGTGKTYSTTEHALRLCRVNTDIITDAGARRIWMSYLRRHKRIRFVTFHPAFSYEDFIEGLHPSEHNGIVSFSRRSGVFRQICDDALESLSAPIGKQEIEKSEDYTEPCTASLEDLWLELEEKANREGTIAVESDRDKHYKIEFYAQKRGLRFFRAREVGGNLVKDSETGLQASYDDLETIWNTKEDKAELPKLSGAEIKKILDKSAPWTAIRLAFKVLLRRGNVMELGATKSVDRVSTSFHRAESMVAEDIEHATSPDFVLVIDEINRGNIARIFGDLLTLIEPSKRIGMPEEFTVRLPLSRDDFGVPRNLHIVGTMNTADRSIALMDLALRRRFQFEELMPNPGVIQRLDIDSRVKNLAAACLSVMNDRIELLYDRDHTLGHAPFLRIRTLEDLRDVFLRDVIPMLQEYFHGGWDKVCIVLGCPYGSDGKPLRKDAKLENGTYTYRMIEAEVLTEESILGFEQDDYLANRLRYVVSSAFINTGEAQLKPYFESLLDKTRRKELESSNSNA